MAAEESSQREFDGALLDKCRELGVQPTQDVLEVIVDTQRMRHFRLGEKEEYIFQKEYVISTSRRGTGQIEDSNQTPLGLHEIKEKIGAGEPEGTIFKGRLPVGMIKDVTTYAPIAHRIMWLSGCEPGFNQGGNCDSYKRYIYIHGLNDEPTLGKPASIGCVHVAAKDLIPLFDELHEGTLVWIHE